MVVFGILTAVRCSSRIEFVVLGINWVYMANHRSALKAVRSSERKAAVNKSRRSLMRTLIKRVLQVTKELSSAGGKKRSASKSAPQNVSQESAQKAFRVAQANIMRNAAKGLLHKKTAARRIARLARSLKTV